ncbi:MAG: L,D-transpeptidase family protein [Daejeonella sp.]
MKAHSLLVMILFICCTVSAQGVNEKQYRNLEKAISRYQKLTNKGEWPKIALIDKTVLKLNDTSKVIPAIKQRLQVLGDLRRSRDKDIYTPKMETAVKQFQLRHGLDDDGVIGPGFMKALNMSLEKRIEQMMVNMDRIRQDTIDMTGIRIIANIPEYRLYVYQDSKEVLTMDIVVGKITNPTIVFSDSLEHVVFSPYWNVPPSIVRAEILPQMSKNSSYLKKNNMEITGTRDGIPTIRQKPGRENSLGNVKFLFPNKYDIYFHDTPAKTLFERKNRAFSHGCIRLSQPLELAKYLLKDQPEWSDIRIREAMNAGTEKWVKLTEPVPVSIIYYTAWIDSSGLVNFRDDIYGHDQEQLNF